jgi:predicted PurR-regulated permease PerM
LRSYVRGRAIVCLVMAVLVRPLALLSPPRRTLLGLGRGRRLIPYIGFMVAAIAIGLPASV